MRLKEPIRCCCLECGSGFVRWRHRGNMSVCTPCQGKARVAAWKVAHPERTRELNRASMARDPQRQIRHNAQTAKWQRNNRGKVTAKTRRRQAALIQRTPSWADHGAIESFYVMAARASECTGLRFQVDHVLPLRGKALSGLHVESNLQILGQRANRQKGVSCGA